MRLPAAQLLAAPESDTLCSTEEEMLAPARVIAQTLRQTSLKPSSHAFLITEKSFCCCRNPKFHTSVHKMAPTAARTITSSHPEKVRMLVLETDEPHPDTQKEKGSFGDILNELLVDAGEAHSPKLAIETAMQYIVEPEGGQIPKKEEITDDVHAIMITGSEWDAHGNDEWIHKLMDLIKRKSSEAHISTRHLIDEQIFGFTVQTFDSPEYASATRFSVEHWGQKSHLKLMANGNCRTRPSFFPTLAASFLIFLKRRIAYTCTKCTWTTSSTPHQLELLICYRKVPRCIPGAQVSTRVYKVSISKRGCSRLKDTWSSTRLW
jgi:hypothetical protein